MRSTEVHVDVCKPDSAGCWNSHNLEQPELKHQLLRFVLTLDPDFSPLGLFSPLSHMTVPTKIAALRVSVDSGRGQLVCIYLVVVTKQQFSSQEPVE